MAIDKFEPERHPNLFLKCVKRRQCARSKNQRSRFLGEKLLKSERSIEADQLQLHVILLLGLRDHEIMLDGLLM